MFCRFSCFLITVLFLYSLVFDSKRKELSLPPGTMGWPFIGEAFQPYSQDPNVFFANKIKRVSSIIKSRIIEMKTDYVEIPGLMASVAEFGHFQPLKGARIIVSSHSTEIAVFIEALTALGAEVRRCFCNIFSTQDHAAARDTERALRWGPDLIVDYGGYATLLIHEGFKAEEIYAETGQVPDPSTFGNVELKIVHTMIRDGLKTDPMKYHKMKERLVGVSAETTDSAKRLVQLQAKGTLLFSVIDISDSVTKSKFDNLYGCRYAFLHGIKRATNNMTIFGKKAVVCGYDGDSEGCAIALKQAGANVVVFVVDPNHAVQAKLRGFDAVKTLDEVVSEADIFVINGIKKANIDLVKQIKKMKNNAIIYNTDPKLGLNSNLDAGLEQYFSGMKHIIIINPQTNTNSSVTVLKNTGYPSFILWSCTSHVVALLELWSKRGTGKYEKKVYALPEHLGEKVAALHLVGLTATVSVETTENVCTTSSEPRKSDEMKKILLMGVKFCALFGMIVALAVLMKKVSALYHPPKLTASASVETTEETNKGQSDHALVPIEEQENSNEPKKSDHEENKGLADDNVSEPKDSDSDNNKKRISDLLVQAFWHFIMVALRVIRASKVSINLIGPKVSIDFPLSAIWDDKCEKKGL